MDPKEETELHILEPSRTIKAKVADGSMTAAKSLYQNDSNGREVRHVKIGKKQKKQHEQIE